MKRIIFTLLIVIIVAAPVVGIDLTTPLVVQLMPDETDALPQNTIELRLRSIEFNSKADRTFTLALKTLATRLSDADPYNYVFELRLIPHGNEVGIAINSLERISATDMKRRDLFGVWALERARFVVISTPENEKMLKTLFSKNGKHNIVQEYEMVDVKRGSFPSNALARWTGTSLNVATIFADGAEQTSPPDNQ